MSIFTIANKTLTAAGKVDLGDPKSGPCHIAFTPDGKMALVTRDGDHRISVLSVDGNKVEDTKKFMVAGFRPYSIAISPKGTVAVLSNQGGGQGDTDLLSVIDLKQKPPRIVDTIAVEQIPEGVTMSPDGNYVAAIMQNGSNKPSSHPNYHKGSALSIFRINGTKLTLAARAEFGALHCMFFRSSCGRRCIPRHFPRGCGHHDCRWIGSRSDADGRRRICGHARIVPA